MPNPQNSKDAILAAIILFKENVIGLQTRHVSPLIKIYQCPTVWGEHFHIRPARSYINSLLPASQSLFSQFPSFHQLTTRAKLSPISGSLHRLSAQNLSPTPASPPCLFRGHLLRKTFPLCIHPFCFFVLSTA